MKVFPGDDSDDDLDAARGLLFTIALVVDLAVGVWLLYELAKLIWR